MSHLHAVHPRIFRVRPKIAGRIFAAHFGETLSCRRLDIGQSCDLTPVQPLAQSPLEFCFSRAVFLLYQECEQHRTLTIHRCLAVKVYNGARHRCAWFRISAARRKERKTEKQNRQRKTEKRSSYHSPRDKASRGHLSLKWFRNQFRVVLPCYRVFVSRFPGSRLLSSCCRRFPSGS